MTTKKFVRISGSNTERGLHTGTSFFLHVGLTMPLSVAQQRNPGYEYVPRGTDYLERGRAEFRRK